MSEYNLYCDGGVILKNPSFYGGTYGWVLVDPKGERVECGSGIVLPSRVGMVTITNNFTELYAALSALDHVLKTYPAFKGSIWTDSKITYFRLTRSYAFEGIPKNMKDKCLSLRRNGRWKPMHLGGHPSKKSLECGRDERGLIVSCHNVWCDEECQRLANLFIEKNGLPVKKKKK